MFDFDFERYGPQMEHINYLHTILGLELNPFERGTISYVIYSAGISILMIKNSLTVGGFVTGSIK